MLDRATEIISQYNELTSKLASPDALKDNNTYKALSKKEGELKYTFKIATQLVGYNNDLNTAQQMLKTTNDGAEKHFLMEEQELLEDKIHQLEKELLIETELKDPNDSRNIILEFRAGTGGDEAALFAGDLMRMYLRFFETRGWKAEQYSTNLTEGGGIKEAIFSVKGNNIFREMKFEGGVHRVQRVPTTESAGRIHTSTASVVVLPEFEDIEVEINNDDIRIDVFRAGGPGGQSVNTTDSAVRITHIPTGLVVSCQDEKSQLKNKHRALSVLKSRLYDLEMQKKQSTDSAMRKSAIQGGDRSAKIRTYNFPQNRVTDHRIKISWHNIESIMNGNIQEIIDTVRANIINPN
jgi:peptide chain release factor 1